MHGKQHGTGNTESMSGNKRNDQACCHQHACDCHISCFTILSHLSSPLLFLLQGCFQLSHLAALNSAKGILVQDIGIKGEGYAFLFPYSL